MIFQQDIGRFYQHNNPPKLLISCPEDRDINSTFSGTEGLYVVDLGNKIISKLLTANCRGIVPYREYYYLATEKKILKLDSQFKIVEEHLVPHSDLHGIRLYNNSLLYIAETSNNSVGVYQLEPFQRINEIKVSPYNFDFNHINDLWIQDDSLYVSMFSLDVEWKKLEDTYDGIIIKYNIYDVTEFEIIRKGLKFPHTVKVIEDNLHFCDSLNLNLVRNNETLAQFNGFTRGLAFDGFNYYIGQSSMRHVSRLIKKFNNVSIDCGIHIFNPYTCISSFLLMPAKQIYEIIVIGDIESSTKLKLTELNLSDSSSFKYLDSANNWYEPESTFRWMASKYAGVNLYAETPINSIVIDFTHCSLVSNLKVKLIVNKKAVAIFSLTSSNEQTYSHNLLEDLTGDICIALEIDEMWSPQHVLGNDDARLLGLAVKKICVY
ncbi:DUF4915 domain-containing protein [Paenibacillus ferrarius]|uniref:DUF4915 domain-containing protein n=1 Tax=Paenibacillus ferrarius TaxID=1469647 RepID=UPI003D2C3BDC